MSETCQQLAFTHPIVVLKSGLKNNWIKKLESCEPTFRLPKRNIYRRIISDTVIERFTNISLNYEITR